MSKQFYNPQQIEEKWLAFWEKAQLFHDTIATADPAKDPFFLLFAFPYPSGSGLHVGHVESKTALDILARYYRMHGKEVFFPIGWDAFGLPAENFAIKSGIHPAETTKNAINTFRRQIKRLAISYNWETEIATSHPGYYKWTQWLFLELYKKGLAYQAEAPVNWCPSCQTVLANEQVVSGHCERCDTEVIQKLMKQWFFKISDYKEELISGLDQVDWPSATKDQQLHWIGKKVGIHITYPVVGSEESLTCFTTRPETNYGASFVVLAPEHPFAQSVATQSPEVAEYIAASTKKTELERQQEGKKKSGVFTGFYVTNRLTGKELPVWVSDFVLAGFGTGAVVGVPGHDKRDFAFAQQFGLPIERVVVSPGEDLAQAAARPVTTESDVFEEVGVMINSDRLNGKQSDAAMTEIMDYLEQQGWGERVTTYKLRDWLISRQRYWGAPIPVVYDPEGNPHPVKPEHLPWELPVDVDFKPTGESPLVSSQSFIERTEQLYGKGWRPEFDTMDTFVDSSWYFLRYPDARNTEQFASPEQLKKWLPVDLYMIGPEHIVLHLLYSRFFTKVLRDAGYLTFDEPFMKMRHQGMILGPDHKKMSKSKGNVINPDDVIEKFGADTLRVYEMFMGPLESDKPWDTSAVAGVYRFLNRLYSLVSEQLTVNQVSEQSHDQVLRKLHQTLRKVSEDLPKLKFNTAIAAMMELLNEIERVQKVIGSSRSQNLITIKDVVILIKMIAPFAPFIAEELWSQYTSLKVSDTVSDASKTTEMNSIHLQTWPTWDEALAADAEVTIAVQVNGKLRGQLVLPADVVANQSEVVALAKQHEKVVQWIVDKTIRKEIYVVGKIVNLVV